MKENDASPIVEAVRRDLEEKTIRKKTQPLERKWSAISSFCWVSFHGLLMSVLLLKNYNSIHERQIEFYPNKMTFIGIDKIIKKKINHNYKFDIRFHIEPNVKLMKTQDNKTILIELEDEGWKFTCDNYDINIDNGLYFGNKNLYSDNQNIFISGISNRLIDNIKWEIKQI